MKAQNQIFLLTRMASGLTSSAIAQAAGISLSDEYLFEIQGPVDEEIKKKIIEAFSTLTGHCYTLSDFERDEKTLQRERNDQNIGIGGNHDLS